MSCSLCGEVCGCVPDDRGAALSGSLSHVPSGGEHACGFADAFPSEREARDRGEQQFATSLERDGGSSRPGLVVDQKNQVRGGVDQTARRPERSETDCKADAATASPPKPSLGESVIAPEPEQALGLPSGLGDGDGSCWREELSERLDRYRARRRPRVARYSSLRLKFEAPETAWAVSTQSSEGLVLATRPRIATDRVEAAPDPGPLTPEFRTTEAVLRQARATQASETTAQIIEFPRGSYAPPVPLSELAEPVVDRPRILEAPEVVPPPPALGGITIEEEQRKDPERRPGIDMPLESVPFERRLLAVAIDVMIVLLASGVFGAICDRIAGARPKAHEMLGLAAGLLGFFWVAYQYLLVVYSGTTPGLRAMKLHLQRFDGSATNRRLRQGRVLGSVLSGISLGMGYAWQFLDEDSLCWHERVTKTCLAPQNQDAKKRYDQSKL